MTAFARARAVIPQGVIAWEIKTVNNKGLDIRLRLPPGFDGEDAACRSLLAGAVSRGSVQATLTLQRNATAPQVRIDKALLATLVAATTEAMPADTRFAPPSMDSFLAVRGVVEVLEAPETPSDRASLATGTLACLSTALEELQTARRTEGAALGTLMSEQLLAIRRGVDAAEAAPGRTPEAVRARLQRALEALIGNASGLDPERLHQEAVLLALRADVREEIDRLGIHIGSALELLEAGGPIGRRLDFLAQELAREANTLCAKSNDAGLTAIGLELRNRIEQFREQVQNLE